MKTFLFFVTLLFFIACDNGQNEDAVNFPLTLKAREVKLKQEVRVFTKDREITDTDIIARFLSEEPKFSDLEFTVDEILKEKQDICFLSEKEAVLDFLGGKDSLFEIDTLYVEKEEDEFTFFYYIYRDTGGDVLTAGGVKAELFPKVRKVVPAIGWGDYRKLNLYCAYCKWALQISLPGNLPSVPQKICGTTFSPVDITDRSAWNSRDTLAIKEFYLHFE